MFIFYHLPIYGDIFQSKLLHIVKSKLKCSTLYLQNKIEVYRRDSKRLPCLTDFNYDWEETVYLNLILHEVSFFHFIVIRRINIYLFKFLNFKFE